MGHGMYQGLVWRVPATHGEAAGPNALDQSIENRVFGPQVRYRALNRIGPQS